MNERRFWLGRRAQSIRRYHAFYPTIETQTVGAHTFGVCLILLEICDGEVPANLIRAALYHDVAEAIVGDVPSPVLAQNPALRAAYEAAGDEVDAEHDMAVSLTEEEQNLLKIADTLEAVVFGIEEWQRGNMHVGRMIYTNAINSRLLFERIRLIRVEDWRRNACALVSELERVANNLTGFIGRRSHGA